MCRISREDTGNTADRSAAALHSHVHVGRFKNLLRTLHEVKAVLTSKAVILLSSEKEDQQDCTHATSRLVERVRANLARIFERTTRWRRDVETRLDIDSITWHMSVKSEPQLRTYLAIIDDRAIYCSFSETNSVCISGKPYLCLDSSIPHMHQSPRCQLVH